jgi:hypothetical protein
VQGRPRVAQDELVFHGNMESVKATGHHSCTRTG